MLNKRFKFELGQLFFTTQNNFGVKYEVVKIYHKTIIVVSKISEHEYVMKKGRAREILQEVKK